MAKKLTPQLQRLGINTIGDLLYHFPFRYDDFSQQVTIDQLQPGQTVTVRGVVDSVRTMRPWGRRVRMIEVLLSDDTGQIRLLWFNQVHIAKVIQPGDELMVAGKVSGKQRLTMASPNYEKVTASTAVTGSTHTGRLIPIYATTKGLTTKQLRFLIKQALPAAATAADIIPPAALQAYSFPVIAEALETVHFPADTEQLDLARQRFRFEAFLVVQVRNQQARQQLAAQQAIAVPFQEKIIKQFVAALPFRLTDAQRQSAWDILKDLEQAQPMNRLLEGDVGSGKTLVAALAVLNTVTTGHQVALMVPTDILAKQHYTTFVDLLASHGVRIALLTGKQVLVDDEIVKPAVAVKQLAAGRIDVAIGTHALIQEKVTFKNLVLAIVDEQHRFGVAQRQALQQNSGDQATIPHFLSMTATPIPRSLALTLYGDLDLSVINQLPPGRQPVQTSLVLPEQRAACYQHIKQQIADGRQVFVVCPLIEGSQSLSARSATEVYDDVQQNIFPQARVALLHGRMKQVDKEAVMESFVTGQVDILVSTSVIEVGVNVPNATIMMIESAERFGLAQLHQFRGRVGRGQHPGYCYLLTETDTQTSIDRLLALVESTDGFALAEKDLSLRGPGEVFGTAQSGVPSFVAANLFDVQNIKRAAQWAQKILKKDPNLDNHLALQQRCRHQAGIHLE